MFSDLDLDLEIEIRFRFVSKYHEMFSDLDLNWNNAELGHGIRERGLNC